MLGTLLLDQSSRPSRELCWASSIASCPALAAYIAEEPVPQLALAACLHITSAVISCPAGPDPEAGPCKAKGVLVELRWLRAQK